MMAAADFRGTVTGHGACRVAHPLWEHDTPIPNTSYLSMAISASREFDFANGLVYGPSCGPSDAMIRNAIHCDGLQRSGPRGESMVPRISC